MHLYIISRGIKHDIDRFITELQGKYVPFRYPNDKGEMENAVVQIAVRPIQLWEIVFPEDQKDVVMASVIGEGDGLQHKKKHGKIVYMIRKMLGVDDLPEYKNDSKFPIYKQNMEIVGIGTKKDYWVNPKTKEIINNPTEKQKKECWEGL